MNKYRKTNRADVIRSLVYIFIYLTAISGTSFFLLPERWYLWAIIVIAGLVALVWWHKSATAYRCPHCEREFEISFLVDLLAPHGMTREGGGWLYLRCPNCRRWGKATVLGKTDSKMTHEKS